MAKSTKTKTKPITIGDLAREADAAGMDLHVSLKETKPELPTTEPMPDVSQYIALLGKQGKDKITGFAGTICSVSFDLFGCVQVVLTPGTDKDGKIQDGRWLDANRIEVTRNVRLMPVPAYAAKPAEHDHGPADKPAPRF